MSKKIEGAITVAQLPTKKKITFFSAILIVIGSCIGAGIFFKSKAVLDGAGGNIYLAMFSWVIAAIAIGAMALALIEIVSVSGDNNLSLVGWNKRFNSRLVYKASKNFMFYIYLPLTFFFIPLYFIQTIMDAWSSFGLKIITNFSGDWVVWSVVSFVLVVYFIFTSGYSTRAGDIQNKIILVFKFFPLVFASFAGFILLGVGVDSSISTAIKPAVDLTEGNSLSALSPVFGIFIGIGGIFFAYDGFYIGSGLQTEMKKPQKTPLAIIIGLGIVTVIYLLIAISMSIVGDGTITSFQDVLTSAGASKKSAGLTIGIINILIAIGILGILNGFSVWTPRYIEELIKSYEIPFASFLKTKIKEKTPIVGIIVSMVINTPAIILFSIIGALAYSDTTGYASYGVKMDALYSFADLMATWTAAFAFAFIALSIFGGLLNRRSNKVKVQKQKFFVIAGIIGASIVAIAMVFTILIPIIDLILLLIVNNPKSILIQTRIITVTVLFLYVGIMFLPTLIEDTVSRSKKIRQSNSLN